MYHTLDQCVACNGTDLQPVIDLGKQPLANDFSHKRDSIDTHYPLALNRCLDCHHAQLSVAIDPTLMFKHYLYVTGTSQTLRDYCDDFAKKITHSHGVGDILDVASNDGTQLTAFKNLGWNTCGIEPAKNLAYDCDHDVICDFCENVNVDLQVDVITAQNVMAHTRHPIELLKKMKAWLKPNGSIYIQTSQANMFLHTEFDTMYHEHISFFCSNSMKQLARRAGLTLVNVEFMPIHGTSYLFELRHTGEEFWDHNSIDSHRHVDMTYELFARESRTLLTQLKFDIERYRNDGYKIVGYAAAAKGMTVINAGDLHLDYIVDDNNWKVSRFTPGKKIPICSTFELGAESRVLVINFAWNFHEEICRKIGQICSLYVDNRVPFQHINDHKSIHVLRYFPELEYEKLIG